jgi:predicted nuclease of predicted toxin-antitoxin system
MKFLVDAQLPVRLARFLQSEGAGDERTDVNGDGCDRKPFKPKRLIHL